MATLRAFCSRILDYFRRRRVEQDFEEEIQGHLTLLEERFVRQGRSPDEARRAARRSFGGVELARENHRDIRAFVSLDRLLQDVRYGIRAMRRNPGFTAVALLALALGIGANSAMFSLADALLLRPLPVPSPGELLNVGSTSALDGNFSVLRMSYPDYVDLRDRSRSFDGLGAIAFVSGAFSVRPGALPSLRRGDAVTGNLFDVLGVQPVLGRAFHVQEDRVPGRDAVVILERGFWKSEFDADPSVLGRKVTINGIEFTVVGVTPEGFTGLRPKLYTAFYVPMAMLPSLTGRPARLEDRAILDLRVKGRLDPEVAIGEARAELAALARTLAEEYPDTNRGRDLTIHTELEARIAQSPPDAMFMAMLSLLAAAVLLIACANVAGLLASRARSRAREIAIRMAVGARRIRLIRQLIVENLLLALGGGLLGLAVAYAGVLLARQLRLPGNLQGALEVQLDDRVLVFSLLVALLSTLLFGLLPALHTTRIELSRAAKGADESSPGRLRGRSCLVVGQVAVSLLLLTFTMFLYRAFEHEFTQGPGFRIERLWMMSFNPALAGYDAARTQRFYKDLLTQVRSTSGVKSATLASEIPMGINTDAARILPEGYSLPVGRENIAVPGLRVDPSFFDTMGIPLMEGRGFQETDSADAPRVAVVNETLARHYWPGESAIGKRFRLENDTGPWVEVVGIARNHKYVWIGEGSTDFVYLHHLQSPRTNMTMIVESHAEPERLNAPLRDAVRRLDPGQPVFDVNSMEDFYQVRTVGNLRVLLTTVGAMGLMGLLLALVGLYGLLTYNVSRRTREIGVRMAIGAGRRDVLLMALKQGIALTLSGIGIGLVLSFAAERLLPAVFPAYHSTDVVGYVLVATTLLTVTLLAAYIPARRASRMDPTRALRHE
jgi:putative ABC transport system permease protein